MKVLYILFVIFLLLQIVFSATVKKECKQDSAGDYYVPQGCKDSKDRNKCDRLCKEVCGSKVKDLWSICGDKLLEVDKDDCYCIDLTFPGEETDVK
uniref:Fungal protease-specific inhibitor-F-like protein n=1 Tax=Xenopsylla cheopis TaxID=163159 RepID=A2IAB4_XENCH|nr:fungal protease-specific inhibitor-F-like protein [Xenopsylla cheopis]